MVLPEIDIYQKSLLWRGKISKKFLKQGIAQAASFLNLKGTFSVTILLANDTFIRPLNKTFRGYDKATDVLSFPQQDLMPAEEQTVEGLNLGDIILAYETIEKDAVSQGKDFLSHSMHMVIHGFLHLLGYDHQTQKEASAMEKKEIEILNLLGVKDPYESA